MPHPQVVGGVANYGIKLWGTNASFFVPQGAAGVPPHAAPPPPHPPMAAAPPGVHAQVAQNGTVYYHQPVRVIDGMIYRRMLLFELIFYIFNLFRFKLIVDILNR